MERRQNCSGRFVWLVIVISALLSVVSVSSAVEYIWTQKADMPTPRWNFATCVVDGTIYAVGGEPSEPYELEELLSIVEEYDPSSDTWIKKADLPTPMATFDATVADGKIYAIGGDDNGSMVCMYDPHTDTWTRKADMPTPRWLVATCTVDGRIYAIGGRTPSTIAPGTIAGLKIVEEYDPKTDSWTRKADMLTALHGLSAHVVNGRIYALGGRVDWRAVPGVQEYDPATDTWTRKAEMPIGASQMSSVVLGNKVVVIGGWLWSANYPYRTIQMYDPKTDTWTIEGDTPFLRASASAEVVNNRVYVIGGTDRPHPCIATSTVYELTVNAPPPDFNADGSVDIKDLLTLIESWGQDDPVADIAPALGDGIVDVLDLEFLMGYWGQEIDDPTLAAHWALDETEGMIASDSVGNNEGTVVGTPRWRPNDGKVSGALECDGATFVTTDPVLSPTDGPFSVLAWVKGGGPSQVILSQQGGANWLMADALQGTLTTDLRPAPRRVPVAWLMSDVCVTDGLWHRVAFVWDGSNRRLYVDDVLTAEDVQSSLAGCSGGLHIGAGKDLAPGTFWSGLIDDVRVYNRAVRPQ